jgi:hypothetical protein
MLPGWFQAFVLHRERQFLRSEKRGVSFPFSPTEEPVPVRLPLALVMAVRLQPLL